MYQAQETLDPEIMVAGAILIDERAFDPVSQVLTVDDFHIEVPKMVYEAALSLRQANEPIDPISIRRKCKDSGFDLDGRTIAEYMDVCPTAANVMLYADEVIKSSMWRRTRELTLEVYEDKETPIDELISKLQDGVARISESRGRGRTAKPAEMSKHLWDGIMARKEGKYTTISTGYSGLDRLLGGGLLNGALVILAGRPGMGKTSLALNIADNIRGPVLFISLEMSMDQIEAKRAARLSQINSSLILNGHDLSEQDYQMISMAVAALSESKMEVNKAMGLTVQEIGTLARGMDGIKALFIDYMGLVKAQHFGSRYEMVTSVSNELKQLALSLDIPIVCLAQLNRQTEGRSDKRPMLADLRDSGSLEQDADVVLLMYRDGYYQDEEDNPDANTAGMVEVNVAKNRHGRTGKIQMSARMDTSTFYEIDTYHEMPQDYREMDDEEGGGMPW